MAEMAQWITYNRKPTGSLVTLCSKIIGKFQAEDHSKETYSDIKKHFALFLEIALAKFDPLSRDLVLKSIRQAMLDSTADAISKVIYGIYANKVYLTLKNVY